MPLLNQRNFLFASIVFALVLASNIAGLLVPSWSILAGISKPMLMPILAIALWQHKRSSHQKKWRIVLAGLLAAWMGDIFLMKGESTAFFIAGLSSFLLTHLLYIVYFLKYLKASGFQWNTIWRKPAMLLIVLYAVGFLYVLWPGLGNMVLPVMVYTIVISTMLLVAIMLAGRLTASISNWFVWGAVFFVGSDSILAFNKFHSAVPWSGMWIMATYGIAQWLIMAGTWKNTDNANNIKST